MNSIVLQQPLRSKALTGVSTASEEVDLESITEIFKPKFQTYTGKIFNHAQKTVSEVNTPGNPRQAQSDKDAL